jgi:hypothetical protein
MDRFDILQEIYQALSESEIFREVTIDNDHRSAEIIIVPKHTMEHQEFVISVDSIKELK